MEQRAAGLDAGREEAMAAVQIERSGGPLVVRRLPVPRPGRGEVLVRVAAAPINPSDLGFIAGSYAGASAMPAVPGFEGSGTVVAAGAGLVPRLLVGRRVALATLHAGTWAEYVVAPFQRCVPVGDGIPLAAAASLIVNPMTALAFFDLARQGRHAALISNAAAGALGRMIARLGRSRGVPVIHVVRRREQVEVLRVLGAEHVLVSREAAFADELRSRARRLRATLVLDAVGGPETLTLVEAAPPGSTLLAYAALSGEPSVFNARTLIADEKRVAGFYLGHWAARRGLWRTLRDVARVRRLAGAELQTPVQRRFPLAAAQEAVDAYRHDMTAGKVLLVADPLAVALA